MSEPSTHPPHVPEVTPPPRPLYKNVSFQLLWTSVAAAGFGDRLVQMGAWSMLGYHEPGSQAASIQAAVNFFFFLPYVLLGSLAGWLADTLPRRWILLTCDELRAVLLVIAAILVPAGAAVAIPADHHWKVYAIVAAAGTLAAIFSPAKAATVPQVVPAEKLQPANAIVLGIAVIASLLGLLIGAPIIEKYSVRAALLVGAGAFAISGLFFLGLRIRRHERLAAGPKQSQGQRLWEAVRYTVTHRAILNLTLLSVLFWGGAHVITAAIAALCKTAYGLPENVLVTSVSHMLGALGGGMLLSSLWVAWINTRRESGWFAMGMLVVTGLAMVVLALSKSHTVGMISAACIGYFGNTAMICVATLTQSIAPDYIRGRVFGVRDIVTTISAVAINFVIWRTPNADRHMIGVLLATALLLAGVGFYGMFAELVRGPLQTRLANTFWHFVRSFTLVWHRVRWVGKHNIPATGPAILAANHTTGLDPFLMQGPARRTVRWLMLGSYRYRMLNPLWDAINPICIDESEPAHAQLRAVLGALKKGDLVGLFPEGKLQREHRVLDKFEPGIAMIAVRSGAPIVPVWIHGTPRTRAMFWHFMQPSRSVIIFGEPYRPDPKLEYAEIAEELRHRMQALGQAAEAAEARKNGGSKPAAPSPAPAAK